MGRKLTKYSLVGVINTAAGYGTILLCLAAGIGDYAANAIGYAVGFTLSFVLNRRFTFGRRGAVGHGEVLAFAASACAAYAVNLAVLTAARSAIGEGNALAQLAANIAYTATFYVLSARYVFAERPR